MLSHLVLYLSSCTKFNSFPFVVLPMLSSKLSVKAVCRHVNVSVLPSDRAAVPTSHGDSNSVSILTMAKKYALSALALCMRCASCPPYRIIDNPADRTLILLCGCAPWAEHCTIFVINGSYTFVGLGLVITLTLVPSSVFSSLKVL